MFTDATREGNKLRLALDGPSGAGKTYTALRLAHAIQAREGGTICVIDTERGSAKKYAGDTVDDIQWAWKGVELASGQHSPQTYANTIKAAASHGFDILIVDSLSHAWSGAGGALDQVDRSTEKGGKFSAWRNVTPQHNAMVDAILDYPGHVIVTMRTKMEHVLEEDERTRKTTVRKVGMKPIQREGLEYEFDIVCDMDLDHVLTVSKTRCSAIDGQIQPKPGPAFIDPILRWLNLGEAAVAGPAPITSEQVELIRTALPLAGVSKEQLGKAAAKLGASTPRELTSEQAEKLIDMLHRRIANKGGEQAEAKPAEPSSEKPAPAREGVVLADEALCQQIREKAKAIAWPVEKLRIFLERQGVKRVSELERSVAAKLLTRLEYEDTKKQAEQVF